MLQGNFFSQFDLLLKSKNNWFWCTSNGCSKEGNKLLKTPCILSVTYERTSARNSWVFA
uniref:Uncharacterized protein n=1 Tax=Manihot esculenta TaxID=3983 RepID=A0A2C9WK98_MANES